MKEGNVHFVALTLTAGCSQHHAAAKPPTPNPKSFWLAEWGTDFRSTTAA